MEHMEIMISQVLGCLSLTLYAHWDTRLPANLEYNDIRPGIDTLPPELHGLTSISHCLWRYHILYHQRTLVHWDEVPRKDLTGRLGRGMDM
jgi:hypothetical protein